MRDGPFMTQNALLHVEKLSKTYATPVLNEVSFSLYPGEVLALAGENGAGKSTLTKIIAGLVPASSGTMQLNGQPFQPHSRQDAEKLGVRMVLQELGTIPTLSVAENLMIDHLPGHAGWIDRHALNHLAREALAKIGLTDIDPQTLVGELGVGYQQMVEIARNMMGTCKLLILDEPTAALTNREIEHLFVQIQKLKREGVAIIYISHRLDELLEIADRVMVLRDGRHIATRNMHEVNQDDIVKFMVGKEVREALDRPRRVAGNVVLEVRNLKRGTQVKDANLKLHAGEVLGIAGLVGSGRTELLRLIFGADSADSGQILLNGKALTPVSPAKAVKHGMGLVTEDRKTQGLLLSLAIQINATLANIRAIAPQGWLHLAQEREQVAHLNHLLHVRSQGVEQPVGELSGGNQQKVVFARWLHRDCEVLLLDEPTRGVDIGARADIYAQIDQMAGAGKALMMVSSDLRELMSVCDRIAVMSAGRLVQIFERGEWTQHKLLEAAFSGYLQKPASPQTTSTRGLS